MEMKNLKLSKNGRKLLIPNIIFTMLCFKFFVTWMFILLEKLCIFSALKEGYVEPKIHRIAAQKSFNF